MSRFLLIPAMLTASPALAATGPFFSLGNTDFIVTIAFLLFIAILVHFKVPALVMGQLDKRAETIRKELDEARAIREEAQSVLAEFERKHRGVTEQAERIVAQAKEEARLAREQAEAELKRSVERRIAAAQDQIASAEASAVREVRDTAISVAVAAAGDVVGQGMDKSRAGNLIDAAITEVGEKLH